jgi:hypothetical protein
MYDTLNGLFLESKPTVYSLKSKVKGFDASNSKVKRVLIGTRVAH